VAAGYAPLKEDSALDTDSSKPDHQGFVTTYMTFCSGGCSNFSANNAQWFKLDADGYDSSTKHWASDKLISSWSCRLGSGMMY
jgi:hypothetical protein